MPTYNMPVQIRQLQFLRIVFARHYYRYDHSPHIDVAQVNPALSL